MTLRPVIHIHDGAVEEYMATLLLHQMTTTELKAVVVVDGDCLGGIATQAAWQLAWSIGSPIPVGLSAARPKNPFPWPYRSDCILQSKVLEDLGQKRNTDWPFAGPLDESVYGWPPSYPRNDPAIRHEGDKDWVQGFPSGEVLLTRHLKEAKLNHSPMTVAITGPPTPLITVLDREPDLCHAIEEVVWYGPSLEQSRFQLPPVPEHVFFPYTDWNAFWDPYATKRLFDPAPFKVTMIPRTLASSLRTSEFLDLLDMGTTPVQGIAAKSYATVAQSKERHMWDTLTVSYLGAERDKIFPQGSTPMRLRSFEAGPLQGVVAEDRNGAETNVVNAVDKKAFFDFVFDSFGRRA